MEAAIVHYNTPDLTGALVRSIRKCSPGVHVTIFDNSDWRQFPATDGVTVIDNTKGQIVDFDAMIQCHPYRRSTINGYASAKHIASVDALFDLVPDGFLLLDSDVLLTRDVREFFDNTVAWKGYEEKFPDASYHRIRLHPFCLWINVPMLREHGIRFWHEGMVDCLDGESPYYDTGASLLFDCRAAHLPGTFVDIYEYIVHFGRGSYGKNDWAVNDWLMRNRELYE